MAARRGHGGGINCTLSYRTADGKTRAYRLRAVKLVHGLTMVGAEGKSRTGRAYYPHKRSAAQFMVTFALLARRRVEEHAEYENFNVWMRNYMALLLDLDYTGPSREMTVSIPTRQFTRQAIPIGPLQFGEHLGSMVWYQTITFETTFEPEDTKFAISKFDFNNTDKDRNARYFYPRSVQLSGNQKPVTYDGVNTIASSEDMTGVGGMSAAAIQQAVNGAQAAYEAGIAGLDIPVGEI